PGCHAAPAAPGTQPARRRSPPARCRPRRPVPPARPATGPARRIPPGRATCFHLNRGAAMAKILLVIGDAAEVLDTFYPLHRLREAGYTVHVAGPEARVYHLVQHDRHPDWD